MNKKGDWISCGNMSQQNMRHVTYESLQYLGKTHKRARKRRQHREWLQCLVLKLIQKQRHVTKLECYSLWEMSQHQINDVWQLNVFEYGRTKFPEDANTAGSGAHTHTHTHARAVTMRCLIRFMSVRPSVYRCGSHWIYFLEI